MKCPTCGKQHDSDHPHIMAKLSEKGFPTKVKGYASAHAAADRAEKKKFPKGYQALKKMDITAGKKHELIGKNTKSGKIEVSEKVPKKLRAEVAYHEKTVNKILRKRKS